MNELKLKNQVGLFLIISQFVLAIIVFIFNLKGGYSSSEFSDTIALMLPMFTVYTGSMLKFFISNRSLSSSRVQSDQLTIQFVFLTWFLIGLFVFALLSIIILKPLNYISDFNQFKIYLATIETIFGAFTGAVISTLVDK